MAVSRLPILQYVSNLVGNRGGFLFCGFPRVFPFLEDTVAVSLFADCSVFSQFWRKPWWFPIFGFSRIFRVLGETVAVSPLCVLRIFLYFQCRMPLGRKCANVVFYWLSIIYICSLYTCRCIFTC